MAMHNIDDRNEGIDALLRKLCEHYSTVASKDGLTFDENLARQLAEGVVDDRAVVHHTSRFRNERTAMTTAKVKMPKVQNHSGPFTLLVSWTEASHSEMHSPEHTRHAKPAKRWRRGSGSSQEAGDPPSASKTSSPEADVIGSHLVRWEAV